MEDINSGPADGEQTLQQVTADDSQTLNYTQVCSDGSVCAPGESGGVQPGAARDSSGQTEGGGCR